MKKRIVALSTILVSLIILLITGTSKSMAAANIYDNKDFLDYQYNNKNIVVGKNGPSLTVGTYNIASGLHDHVINAKKVGRAIKTLNADFIGLQEVDKGTKRNKRQNVAKIIAKESGMKYYYFHATVPKFQGGEYGTAVLSKYPIKKVKAVKLYTGKEEPRQIIIAQVKIPHFKRPVYFINVHTDYHVDGKIRTKEMNTLNELLNDDASDKVKKAFPNMLGGIIIAVGDFNASANDPSLASLKTRWTIQQDPKRTDYRSWPAMNPTVDYDHIITSNSQKWQVNKSFLPSSSEEQKNINWPKISDHLPLVMKMTLTEY